MSDSNRSSAYMRRQSFGNDEDHETAQSQRREARVHSPRHRHGNTRIRENPAARAGSPVPAMQVVQGVPAHPDVVLGEPVLRPRRRHVPADLVAQADAVRYQNLQIVRHRDELIEAVFNDSCASDHDRMQIYYAYIQTDPVFRSSVRDYARRHHYGEQANRARRLLADLNEYALVTTGLDHWTIGQGLGPVLDVAAPEQPAAGCGAAHQNRSQTADARAAGPAQASSRAQNQRPSQGARQAEGAARSRSRPQQNRSAGSSSQRRGGVVGGGGDGSQAGPSGRN